jgi:hypothetical protein
VGHRLAQQLQPPETYADALLESLEASDLLVTEAGER